MDVKFSTFARKKSRQETAFFMVTVRYLCQNALFEVFFEYHLYHHIFIKNAHNA
jgi:hypothetical protein